VILITLPPNITPELIKELKEKKAERTAEEKKILTEHMSVRERLENKLNTDILKLNFEDNLGKFSLQFRKLTLQEIDELTKLDRMRNAKQTPDNTDKLKELNDAIIKAKEMICELLAEKSLDKDLDKEYWMSEKGFSGDVLSAIIFGLIHGSIIDERYMTGIEKFLSK